MLCLPREPQLRDQGGNRLGPAKAGGAHERPQRPERVLPVGEDGMCDPELEVVARREGRDADEGQKRPEIIERVLDRRAGQTPTILCGNFPCRVEDLG